MSGKIKVNQWTTTNAKAWNAGHILVIPIEGTLEDDMQIAADFFGCLITELKFKTAEMTEDEMEALPDGGDL